MNTILLLASGLLLVSAFIVCAIWLIGKAIDLLMGKGGSPLPNSIEEAKPGTMLLHSIERGTEQVKELTYKVDTDAYAMEQRAADYLQEPKYIYVEFKDADSRTYRYDRPGLQQRGWHLH